MKIFFIIAALLFFPQLASAQEKVITKPYLAETTNVPSGTITATGTFQSIFAASATPNAQGGAGAVRSACTVQNNGANTMFVYFGPIANATTAKSAQLAPTQSLNCNVGGVVLSDQVSITGTTGDSFYAAQQ